MKKVSLSKTSRAAVEQIPALSVVPAEPPLLVPFEALNPGEPTGRGDRLALPRRIAAAVVAQDNPAPQLVVDVGSYTGEFLEAFLEQFPAARGQWTEPVDYNLASARRRFARFGDRVDYVIGCAGRDIRDGRVLPGVDVLITSWLSIHRDEDGMLAFYQDANALLPPGGWLANLDHIGFANSAWERRFTAARLGFHADQEGPPIHHAEFRLMSLGEHLAAFAAAGFDDAQVVWLSLRTALFMARK